MKATHIHVITLLPKIKIKSKKSLRYLYIREKLNLVDEVDCPPLKTKNRDICIRLITFETNLYKLTIFKTSFVTQLMLYDISKKYL